MQILYNQADRLASQNVPLLRSHSTVPLNAHCNHQDKVCDIGQVNCITTDRTGCIHTTGKEERLTTYRTICVQTTRQRNCPATDRPRYVYTTRQTITAERPRFVQTTGQRNHLTTDIIR